MERTLNDIVSTTTLTYLNDLDPQNIPLPQQIECDILTSVRHTIDLENTVRDKGDKLKKPTSLSFAQIADIMAAIYPICLVSCAGDNADTDYDLLAIYQSEGPDEGTYSTSEGTFRAIARQYNYNLTQKEFSEVMFALRDKVPRRERCHDRDLIAVNNGIFHYDTKQLEPFTPNKIFMTKSHVDYNANAANIVIHNPVDNTDWDVESWMNELSDDPEIVESLWEILGAIIRPNVRWNKSAWLYSTVGNNGKGTLCELMRNLCGHTAYASVPISDFGKDFSLEPLTRASAIIVDENDVGTYIDKAANLKAVITNDVIQINRKFKTPIAYRFYGFMVQCLNEFPRVKDRSDSFYRRQLFIPFEKCFTGHERKYIKDDYLHRSEVLEYVLHKVLHMNYYSLSEPSACRDILDEYKEFNDPVRLFVDDILPQCRWDLLPFTFLYDLYKEWFSKNAPSGQLVSSVTFQGNLIDIVNNGTEWFCKDKKAKIRSKGRMDDPEPLIMQYNLKDWRKHNYTGNNLDIICSPDLSDSYRGIIRAQPSATSQSQTP